jgi:hypothetical protein
MKNLFSIVIVIVWALSANADDQPKPFDSAQGKRICGSMDNLNRLQQEDPDLENRMQQIEQFTNVYLNNKKNQNSINAVITIPVVFHIVYNTTSQNITDAKCQAQINQLNLDFAKMNANASSIPAIWQSVAANTGIQFCLAQRDPNGSATTGIERKQTTVTSFSTNDYIKHTANGGLNAWPATSYLNLWVGNLSGGVLGYAQFPGGSASNDGVVLLYSSVGSVASPGTATNYNLGRTATHEVGHWLNLYHIWGDESGCTGSDNVGDTPNQGPENYGCPSYPHTDNCATASPGVMFMNYMDYTNDACMNMFTAGQSSRMNALFATGGSRASIRSSLGCQAPTGTTCGIPSGLSASSITSTSATISWTAISGATSYNIQYKKSSVTTWTATTSTTNSKSLTGLTAATAYQFQVQAVCASGSSSYSAIGSFTTSATTCSDPYESNNTYTYATQIATNTDYNALIGNSTDQDWFRFTTTSPNTNIKVTLTNLAGDYDVKLYNSSLTLLSTSQNGGTTSETIIRNTTAAGTYYLRVYGYNGAYSATQCYKIRASVSGTSFRFTEDIETNIVDKPVENDFIAYPNPAHDMINILYNSLSSENLSARIFDVIGRTVRSSNVDVTEGENKFSFDLSDLTKGIYFIELNNGVDRSIKKIIVE